MTTVEAFKAQFRYSPVWAGWIGTEREFFLVNEQGSIVPRARELLGCGTWVSDYLRKLLSYELSACQVELHTEPTKLSGLAQQLTRGDCELDRELQKIGLRKSSQEVGPANMPLDVYPDPTGRYEAITKNMSRETLLAACRVIGTHVHIGMPDHETALKVYNSVIEHTAELCELGNGSFGERLAIYRQMAPNFSPVRYESWEDFYQIALENDFAQDPRKCWTLIRISVHGTIEFRMFGATESLERIVIWATRCHELCMNAIS